MKLSRQDFEAKMKRLVQSERTLTRQVLEMINAAERRRHHLDCGYSSLFDWLTRGHGYSESAAQRRIQAARLMRAVPEVAQKIETGEVNLTTLAKTESAIRSHEKENGKVSANDRAEMVKRIEGKSGQQTQIELAKVFPISEIKPETKTPITADLTRVALNLDAETMAMLNRVRDLIAHTVPNASLADVIKYLGQDFVKRRDPLATNAQIQHVKGARHTEAKYSACSKSEAAQIGGSSNHTIDTPENNAAFSRSGSKGSGNPFASAPANGSDRGDQYHMHSRGGTGSINDNSQTQPNPSATTNPTQRKPIPASVRRYVFSRSQGRCEFKDPYTGLRCASRYQLEIDHIRPIAMGGGNQSTNLRCLCRAHNQRQAETMYG